VQVCCASDDVGRTYKELGPIGSGHYTHSPTLEPSSHFGHHTLRSNVLVHLVV
jgi:hypothetical protein